MDTYEKKYKESLQKIRKLIEKGKGNGWTIISYEKDFEEIFPELKESEGERIRKAIICGMNVLKEQHKETFAAIPIDDCIAWLEKQGKPAEINPTEFDTRLQNLIGQFDCLPKEELLGSLGFWLNVVQNDGTYKEEKQGEQKSAWSENETKMLDNLITYLNGSKGLLEEIKSIYTDFLKSLKGRVQPKQEWSEEDEERLQSCLNILQARGIMGDTETINTKWLKSLKQRIKNA